MVKMFYDRGPSVWVLQWAEKRQHFSSKRAAEIEKSWLENNWQDFMEFCNG